MTLFDNESELYVHLHKKHNCPYCKSKKTVGWVEAAYVWMCSACGQVDRPRTEKESSCSNGSKSSTSNPTES